MGTFATTRTYTATATAFGNQRKIDRTQNGVLWAVTNAQAAGGNYYVSAQYSTDGGTTWSTPVDVVAAQSSSTVSNSSFFIDVDDFAHLVYKGGDGLLNYLRGTPNAARTAYAWSAVTQISASSAAFDYPDIVAFRDPANTGAWVAYAVYNTTGSATTKVFGRRINISSAGTITVTPATNTAGDQIDTTLATANSNPAYASIDFNHTGDGKTVAGGTPHLYIGWSAGATGAGYGIRFRKATYSAGSWTWGTEREIDNSLYVTTSSYVFQCHFDGTRAVIAAGAAYAGVAGATLFIADRDAADNTTTVQQKVAYANNDAGALFTSSSNYDSAGNVTFFGIGQTSLISRKWTRSGNTLSTPTTIGSASAAQGYFSARRGYQGQALDYVYTAGTASPYTVTSGRIVLNQNPTAPAQLTPADNTTWDSATDQTVTLGYSDPDGNPASKVRVYYRPKGTSAAFAVIEQNTTAASGTNISVTIPAGTWPGQIEHYEQVADSSGAWSDPSTTRTVTGIPAALAAATGGGGGTAFSAWTISNATENARVQRVSTRALITTVTAVSPLTITVDGGPVTAMRNAGYTPTAQDTVQAEYVSGAWVVQDKVVAG
jgi:hypothetical protein